MSLKKLIREIRAEIDTYDIIGFKTDYNDGARDAAIILIERLEKYRKRRLLTMARKQTIGFNAAAVIIILAFSVGLMCGTLV